MSKYIPPASRYRHPVELLEMIAVQDQRPDVTYPAGLGTVRGNLVRATAWAGGSVLLAAGAVVELTGAGMSQETRLGLGLSCLAAISALRAAKRYQGAVSSAQVTDYGLRREAAVELDTGHYTYDDTASANQPDPGQQY